MKNHKGITPIIAVVLLIVIAFVAVGSVATLVTQFTDTDVLDQWQDQQEVGQIDFSMGPGYADSVDMADGSEEDNILHMNFRYTGPNDISTMDTEGEHRFGVRYAPEGESPVEFDTFQTIFGDVRTLNWDDIEGDAEGCLEDAGFGTGDDDINALTQGDSFNCTTAIEFPGGTESIEVELYMHEHDESWSFTCDPGTSSTSTCQ